MKIWKVIPTLEMIEKLDRGTMMEHLGIKVVEVGDDYLKATMTVDHRIHQPQHVLHGGASCVMAESLASYGANFCVDPETSYCVGLDITTSHVRSVKEGVLTATAKPLHIGRTTQLWEIPMHDADGKLVSMTQFRVAVLDKKR